MGFFTFMGKYGSGGEEMNEIKFKRVVCDSCGDEHTWCWQSQSGYASGFYCKPCLRKILDVFIDVEDSLDVLPYVEEDEAKK